MTKEDLKILKDWGKEEEIYISELKVRRKDALPDDHIMLTKSLRVARKNSERIKKKMREIKEYLQTIN